MRSRCCSSPAPTSWPAACSSRTRSSPCAGKLSRSKDQPEIRGEEVTVPDLTDDRTGPVVVSLPITRCTPPVVDQLKEVLRTHPGVTEVHLRLLGREQTTVMRVDSRLAEAPAPTPARWLQVGTMRLDLQRRVLHDGDRSTALSQREFILLGHLMRRAGEVCTRDELLSDVWGFCFDPGSNVLEVYVGRLRAKIDRWHIETVRNVGYCFSA